MPRLDRQLTGHAGGLTVLSILQECSQVAALLVAQGRHTPIIQDEQRRLGQRGPALGLTAIAFCHQEVWA
jgi:hypothetical protein